jgi:hypothetical protein
LSTKVNDAFAKLLHSPNGAAEAIRNATQEALAEHGKAGRPVPIWRDEKVVWVKLDEEGNIVGDV